jgi:formiminoglutamase
MSTPKEDLLWPRASAWMKPVANSADSEAANFDLALMGIPAHLTSISPTNAHTTPAAIRAALQRFSTYNWSIGQDVSSLSFADFGDVVEPDSLEGEARTSQLAGEVVAKSGLAIGLGGDNSVTFAMARGVFGDNIETAGLITLDAHHDLRDGISNGSPVRRLIEEAGLDGRRIVQIGIADFSNSPAYAARAKELGIHVIARSQLRNRPLADVMAEAVAVAGAAGGPIHVDFDVDVCDRSAVPACPAAAPGGICADEFRQLAFEAGRYSQVKSVDFTEIDASIDSADGRTVRLAALAILELAAGRLSRV